MRIKQEEYRTRSKEKNIEQGTRNNECRMTIP